MSAGRFEGLFTVNPEDIASIGRAVRGALAKMNLAMEKMRKENAVLQRGRWTPEQNDLYLRAIADNHRARAQRHLDNEIHRVRKELGL